MQAIGQSIFYRVRYRFVLNVFVVTEKYKDSCVGWGAHAVDQGSIWYYYRPEHYSCELDEVDIIKTEATVSMSPVMTTGKFPEYHKVWEDRALESVVVFGIADEDVAVENDAGFSGFKEYHERLLHALRERGATDLKVSPDVIGQPTADRRTLAAGLCDLQPLLGASQSHIRRHPR